MLTRPPECLTLLQCGRVPNLPATEPRLDPDPNPATGALLAAQLTLTLTLTLTLPQARCLLLN